MTMRKRDRLKKEALECTTFRGHKMGKFKNFTKDRAESVCTVCGAWVQVDAKPMPNGIDTAGSAVAEHCPIHKVNQAHAA